MFWQAVVAQVLSRTMMAASCRYFESCCSL